MPATRAGMTEEMQYATSLFIPGMTLMERTAFPRHAMPQVLFIVRFGQDQRPVDLIF
jgi:hypothetical protein